MIENFDSGTFPPIGWQEYHSGVDALTDSNIRAYSVPNSSVFDDAFGVDTSWLVTSVVNIPSNGELTFWQNQNYDSYYIYHGIWISLVGGNPSNGSYIELDSLGAGTEDTWEKITLDLSAYTGQNVYIAFKYIGDFADEWHVDNVMIDSAGALGCTSPLNITDSTTGSDSAILKWTPLGGELYWKIEYGLTGFTLGTGSFVYANVPYKDMQNLQPNTTYDFYIQAFCSSTDSSAFSPVFSLTTECSSNGNMVLPFQEGFENSSIPSIPCGWYRLDVNSDTNFWITDTTNPNTGNQSAFISYSAPGINQNDWLYTPAYNVLDTTKLYVFGFSYASRSGSAFPEKLAVHSTKIKDGTSIQHTFFEDTAILTNNIYKDTSFTFKFNDTGKHYFGFHLFSNPDQWNFMLDDVFFREKGSIGIKEIDIDNIIIYPNPTKSQLHFRNNTKIINYSIYDVSGKKLEHVILNSKKGELSLETYKKGIYFIVFMINSQSITKQIIKH